MLKNILIITMLAFGGSAFAQDFDTYQVVGKNHYQGDNLVRLKKLANQKLNALGEDASAYELVGVSIRAKSKRGNGTATLIVGHDQDTRRVDKIGGDLLFNVTAPWAYNTIHWDLSGAEGQSNERWQLRFNGNIKVREINLHMASRTKRVRIPMGGKLFTQNSQIYLKQQLTQMGYHVYKARLKSVTLLAKSKAGRGKAELHIGQKIKPLKNIGQSPNGAPFEANGTPSFNRVRWRANGATLGNWQIHMRGRIRVKAVIVEFN